MTCLTTAVFRVPPVPKFLSKKTNRGLYASCIWCTCKKHCGFDQSNNDLKPHNGIGKAAHEFRPILCSGHACDSFPLEYCTTFPFIGIRWFIVCIAWVMFMEHCNRLVHPQLGFMLLGSNGFCLVSLAGCLMGLQLAQGCALHSYDRHTLRRHEKVMNEGSNCLCVHIGNGNT